jgi:hypothetical protein
VAIVGIVKTHKWIYCPVCRNDKEKFPEGCNLCSAGKDANPGFVKVPIR